MCDFFKDLELTDDDIMSSDDLNSLKENEGLLNTTITDADKFIIAGWLVNEENLSDERIIGRVKYIVNNLLYSDFDTFDNKIKIFHNQIDKRETLVVISFSQMLISKKHLAICFKALCRIGIKGCNVLIMLNQRTHTFQISTTGTRYIIPKVFEELWDFIVEHESQDDHAFTIELNPVINRFEGKVFKRQNIVFYNYDSDTTLDRDEMEYVEYMMRPFNISDISIYSQDSLANLLAPPFERKYIPVILRKGIPHFDEIWNEIEVPEDYDIYKPKGILFGYYCRNTENFCKDFCNGPHIVLYPTAIKQYANMTGNIPFELLFSQVLLHEFAHALMDNGQCCRELFSKAMEESLANMITLQIFSKYDINNYERIRSFIVNDQPTIYQFGAYQFDINADWRKWKESKKNMPTLKTWFDKCFDAGKIRDNLKYSLSDYDAVFI